TAGIPLPASRSGFENAIRIFNFRGHEAIYAIPSSCQYIKSYTGDAFSGYPATGAGLLLNFPGFSIPPTRSFPKIFLTDPTAFPILCRAKIRIKDASPCQNFP
ncbi:MAG TPA: hypothetical protein PLZ33_06020, partial [Smithellaceae bacterium]|nr:hypothetical protein [Smithellaceae bacterium]